MHRANVAVLADNNPDTQKNRNCSSSTPHLMGHGPGRLVKTRGRPHGHDGSSSISSGSTPQLMGSGPGRPVKTHGPPHGPIAARPGPSNFQRMGRGPARPIKISELLHRDQCRFPVECPGLRSRPSLPNLVTIARFRHVRSKLARSSPGRSRGRSSICLLYTSPSPRDLSTSRMPSSA